MQCHRCGTSFDGERVPVRGVCSRCSAFLHCCRNCDFYAPGVANDCREPQAARVADKEQGNFCDWFRPAATRPAAHTSEGGARAALDALFKRKRDEHER
ncbi:MAG: hypothetical protein E6J60_04645 [Deltaproteobacteria bacterium]|nr:MAG: hypothetical protein E6J60_04645 [Deltaproteobacteria bacterium]